MVKLLALLCPLYQETLLPKCYLTAGKCEMKHLYCQ